MQRKLKLILLTIVSLLSLAIAISNNSVISSNADSASWLMCQANWGDDSTKQLANKLYQVGQTEYLPYLLSSKSSLVTSDSNINPYNKILEFGGYRFGKDNTAKTKSPFDEYGFRGIKYSSYIGEWKYYNIDACKTSKTNTNSTDYGEFYKGRLDPLTTYSERFSSTDPRVQQLENNKYWLSFKNLLSNIFLSINKTIIAIGISVIGLTFSDISDVLGITDSFTQNIFNNLYHNFFIPLEFLMFLLSALYVLYYGLIKREYRQSLINGLVKPLVTLFVALVFILYPKAISAPNKIATMGQTIIVSTLSHTVTSKSADDLCASSRGLDNIKNGDLLSSAGDSMRSMLGCRIWKEFVFKPWVKGQWHTDDYKTLNKLPNINSKWVKEPKVKLGNKEITNWAVFQQSVQSGLHEPVDKDWSAYVNDLDKDWYRIVDALSNYDEEVIRYGEGGGGGSSEGGDSGTVGGKSASAEAFLKENGEAVKKVADEAGLYASVMLAQAALESGWGKSPSGTYNYFGIKCFSNNCTTLGTREVYGGQSTSVSASFQNFDSPEAGWEGYAMFLWGKGAGADFSGAQKAKSPSPQAAITAIAPHYATDPKYVSSIMSLIKTYDLTKYDTDNKEPTNPDKYHPYGSNSGKSNSSSSSSSGDSSSGSSGGYKVVRQIPSKPLSQWDYWCGNIQGARLGNTFIAILFGVVGISAPLVLSCVASAYGIGITLLTMVAPAFLLFGLWAGKGENIMKDYLGTLLSTVYKKVIISFLVIISVVFTSSIMDMINTIGIFRAFIYMLIISTVIIKRYDEILNAIGKVNLGSMNFDGFHKGVKSITNSTKFATQGVVSAFGGLNAARKLIPKGTEHRKKYMLEAGRAGASEFIRSRLATTETGRRANTIFEKGRKDLANKGNVYNPDQKYSQHLCPCGNYIAEGEPVWELDGKYYHEECAYIFGIVERGGTPFVFDNTTSNERIVIPKVSTVLDDEGNPYKISQPTYEDLIKIGLHSSDNSQIDNYMLGQLAKKSIEKAKYDSNYYESLLKSGKSNLTFDKANVPSFLLSHMNQKDIEGFTDNSNREEAVKNFPKAVSNAWVEWYKANISTDEQKIEDFLQTSGIKTKDDEDSNPEEKEK